MFKPFYLTLLMLIFTTVLAQSIQASGHDSEHTLSLQTSTELGNNLQTITSRLVTAGIDSLKEHTLEAPPQNLLAQTQFKDRIRIRGADSSKVIQLNVPNFITPPQAPRQEPPDEDDYQQLENPVIRIVYPVTNSEWTTPELQLSVRTINPSTDSLNYEVYINGIPAPLLRNVGVVASAGVTTLNVRIPETIQAGQKMDVVALAFTQSGLYSEPANLSLIYSPSSNSIPRPSKRLALVIGNDNYTQFSPLNNPINDATDLKTVLERMSFQVTLLTNVTKAELEQGIRGFEASINKEDTVLFYYSGHGLQIDGRNYLVPVDAAIQRVNEVPYYTYEVNQLIDKLNEIEAKVNIIILDACRNNSFTKSTQGGLAVMSGPIGSYIVYSTAPGTVAYDGVAGSRNSPFTKHLLQTIDQPNLTIEEVFKSVRSKVMRETGGQQIPWDSSSLIGDFYFFQ